MQRCILLFFYFFCDTCDFLGRHAPFFFVMTILLHHLAESNFCVLLFFFQKKLKNRRCILLHHLAESKTVASSLLTRLRVAATAGVQGLC